MRLYYVATVMLVLSAILITYVLCKNDCKPDVRIEVKVVEDTVKANMYRQMYEIEKQRADRVPAVRYVVKVKYDTIRLPAIGSPQADSQYREVLRKINLFK